MTEQYNNIQFPCDRCPAHKADRRLLGIYEQRQEGLHMQRVKVHRGVVTPSQLGELGELAEEYTPDYPLHLTTRQDLELHGVRPEDLPHVQAKIAEIGLTTVGACGDTLRNVTVCPGSGLLSGTPDVSQLADQIKRTAESLPFIRDMPRKFKISISTCEELCARPWINDLGFIARSGGTFCVIGAGSMGRRPATGIELYESIPADHVLPMVVASLRFFNEEGNRELRYSARFRHVRERMGDEVFRARLNGEFDRVLQEGRWPTPQVSRVRAGKGLNAHLRFPLGDISGLEARQIARMAKEADASIRLGFVHDMLFFADQPLKLSPEFNALQNGPTVVACPGTTWCQRGLADSRGTEHRIRELWPDGLNLSIGISGCPNNCAHAGVADIGLTGRIKKIDGERTPCFRLFAGGGNGKNADLGILLHSVVPAEEAPEIVAMLAKKYGDRNDGNFRNFIEEQENNLSAEIEQKLEREKVLV